MVTLLRPSTDSSQVLTVNLSSSDPSQISLPSQVVIPAGEQNIQFSVTAVDDAILELPSVVRIIAQSTEPSLNSGAIQITVLDNDSQWHNYVNPLDVDHDGAISPLDVISIINYLNANQNLNLAGVAAPTPRSYLDIDEDLTASPLDVLIVINYLNQRANGEGEGTGSSQNELIQNSIQSVLNSEDIESWKRRASGTRVLNFEGSVPKSAWHLAKRPSGDTRI